MHSPQQLARYQIESCFTQYPTKQLAEAMSGALLAVQQHHHGIDPNNRIIIIAACMQLKQAVSPAETHLFTHAIPSTSVAYTIKKNNITLCELGELQLYMVCVEQLHTS